MEVYVAGVLASAASMASRVTVPMFRIYMVNILVQTVFALTKGTGARRVIEIEILTKIMTFSL